MAKNNLEANADSGVTKTKDSPGIKIVSWIVPLTPERKAFREAIRQIYLDYVESEKRADKDYRQIRYGLGTA